MIDSGIALLWALAAAVIVAIGAYIWSQWLRRRPGLSGRWTATFTSQDGTKNAEDLEIKSWLWFVWGTSTCKWKETAANEKVVAYKFQGRRKERTITATYRAVDQDSLDMGVFIVRISPSGRTGTGIITSYDSPADQEEFDFQHLDACKDYHWQKVLPT